jgi:glycine/serine hydroxymethyltransferase
MDRALQNKDNQEELENIKQEVIKFTKKFPVPAIN